MEKDIKKLLKDRKFIRYAFNPLALLLLWVVLTVLYVITFDTSFSIWSYNHPNADFTKLTFNPLYKGTEIAGQFKAQDNNLGIVSIRFQTFIRPPYSLEDHYLFKLKEIGAKNWYYENTYRSGLVYDVPFFPFGFPQITNSKGKTYEFQIISLNGNSINALEISSRKPILVSKYKYSGHELLQNKKELINFIFIKFYNAFHNPDLIFSSFIYLLPFLFYLAWISFLENTLKPITNRISSMIRKLERNPYFGPVIRLIKKIFIHNLDYFLVFVVSVDIFVIQLTNDVVYLVIAALWIATLKVNKQDSSKSFIVGIVLIVLCPLFLALKSEPTAEKSGAWSFVFLAVGMLQLLFESKKNNK